MMLAFTWAARGLSNRFCFGIFWTRKKHCRRRFLLHLHHSTGELIPAQASRWLQVCATSVFWAFRWLAHSAQLTRFQIEGMAFDLAGRRRNLHPAWLSATSFGRLSPKKSLHNWTGADDCGRPLQAERARCLRFAVKSMIAAMSADDLLQVAEQEWGHFPDGDGARNSCPASGISRPEMTLFASSFWAKLKRWRVPQRKDATHSFSGIDVSFV